MLVDLLKKLKTSDKIRYLTVITHSATMKRTFFKKFRLFLMVAKCFITVINGN